MTSMAVKEMNAGEDRYFNFDFCFGLRRMRLTRFLVFVAGPVADDGADEADADPDPDAELLRAVTVALLVMLLLFIFSRSFGLLYLFLWDLIGVNKITYVLFIMPGCTINNIWMYMHIYADRICCILLVQLRI